MGKSTKVVLYDPYSEPYKVVGHKGKVIKFRKLRGIYPRNIAQLHAAIHAGSTWREGHTVFCGSCGARTTVENIARGDAWGWTYNKANRAYTCYTCAQS